jgi:hypothetical protein
MSYGEAHLSEILTKYLRVLILCIHNFHTIFKQNIHFNYFDHCFSMIFVSFVAMVSFYKLCTETDFATLHYVSFVEPFGVFPTETLSFGSKQFTNNSIAKQFE